MIRGCSIIMIQGCRMAGVAIICRVDAGRAAKRVTIPRLQGQDWPVFQAALSVILFNKVNYLAAGCSNLREFSPGKIWQN
jgi:hypothetical protein